MNELGYGGCDAELREAAAALRPPEGEVGEVIRDAEQYVERLDANEYYSNSPPVVISPKFVRAALAHLRRIAPAPAAEKPEPLVIEQSRESLTVGPFSFQDNYGVSFETIEAVVCITVWEPHEAISFNVNRDQSALIHSWFGRWLSHDSD
jgi:hypothetical protein